MKTTTDPLARAYRLLMLDLIGLTDQLEQWAANAPEAERGRVNRIHDGLVRVLVSHGVRPTALVGTKVDVRFHTVVATRVVADPEGTEQIAEIFQSGWELTTEPTTLRLAKVVATVADEQHQESDHD